MAQQITMVSSSFVTCWENDTQFHVQKRPGIDIKTSFAGRICNRFSALEEHEGTYHSRKD